MLKPPPKTGPRRDVGLQPAALQQVDTSFFEGKSPSLYFEARLRLLLVALADEEFASAVAGPLETDAYSLPGSDEPLVTPQFAAMEVTNLFHHVAETVWRLFLCIDDPNSSRLALARLGPPQVREALRDALLLTPDKFAHRVRQVLRLQDAGAEATDRVNATARLLRAAAFRLLDHAPLHNATKHGFAVSAEQSVIGFSENADGTAPQISRTGLWLRLVQPVQRDDRECWADTYVAVDLHQMSGLTWLLTRLTHTLWQVGRGYAGLASSMQLQLPSGRQLTALLDQPRTEITRVRFDLPYPDRDRLISMEVQAVAPPETTPLPPDDLGAV